jgi:Flp pilus assembly protein TadB
MKKLIKFLLLSVVIFVVLVMVNILLPQKNSLLTMFISVLILLVIRFFLVKKYGKKVDDYLDNW